MDKIISIVLCIAMIMTLTYGTETDRRSNKDICTRHGIFKLANKFHVSDKQTVNVNINLEDYIYVMEEFDKIVDDFIRKIEPFTTMKGILENNERHFVESMDHKSIFKVEGEGHESSFLCLLEGGNLVGADSLYEMKELERILGKLSLNKIPIHLNRINRIEMVSTNGRTVGKSGWTEAELNNPVYFELGRQATIHLGTITKVENTYTSKNTTILCTKTRTPFDIVSDLDKIKANNWSKKLQRYVKDLAKVKSNFEKEKQKLAKYSETELANQEVKLRAPLEIIRIIEISKRHISNDLFWEMTRQDFEELDRLMTYIREIRNREYFFAADKYDMEILDFDNSEINVTGLIEIGNITIIGRKRNFENQFEAKIELIYAHPGAEVKIFEFHPYIREPLVPESGKILITPSLEVFKVNLDMDSGSCSTFNGRKFCKEFGIPQFEERESNCAKYLLDKTMTNECRLAEPEFPMAVKSDCHGEEGLVSSFHSPYSLELTCNDKPEQVVELTAGIHEVNTECKIKSGGTILVPQIKTKVDRDFATKLVEVFRAKGNVDHTLLLVCVVVICISILLLVLNVGLIVCLCCPKYLEDKECRSCCVISLRNRRKSYEIVELTVKPDESLKRFDSKVSIGEYRGELRKEGSQTTKTEPRLARVESERRIPQEGIFPFSHSYRYGSNRDLGGDSY